MPSLGFSGGCKTTLFNVISGLLQPDHGKVLLDGNDITNQPGHISYMLRKDLLLSYRTIEDNAALLRTYMFFRDGALLEEPFSALDTLTKSSIHKWYVDVMEKIQLSTLFITHDIDEAILLSDRIYLVSGSPRKITGEIIIQEPKPRRDEFNLTAEFLEYKRHTGLA